MQTQTTLSQLRAIIQNAHVKASDSLVTLTISRMEYVRDDFLGMNYCLTLDLAKKPTANSTNQQKKVNPFLNPEGSKVFISKLGHTHNLLFNKFNIFHNHLLVVTQKFQSQKQKVSLEDIKKSTLVSLALKGLFFFNGGDLSGASQPHKHLQILPQQATKLPIFSELLSFVQMRTKQDSSLIENKVIIKFPHFKFLHGIVAVKKTQNQHQLGQALYDAYNQLYNSLILSQGEETRDQNMVGCGQFVAVFVRKQQFAYQLISVNSVGYLGSILFKNQQLFQKCLKNKTITPSSILQEISRSN